MAHEKAAASNAQLTLPLAVVSPADVNRLRRELDVIDEALLQSGVRTGKVKLPSITHVMERLAEQNKLNLLQPEDRNQIKQLLQSLTKAPVIHMSFGADPTPAFMEKIITWLRREVHPAVLVSTGLQPNIGAGCIVRTTNKYFDFSLRQHLAGRQDVLRAKLHEAIQGAQS